MYVNFISIFRVLNQNERFKFYSLIFLVIISAIVETFLILSLEKFLAVFSSSIGETTKSFELNELRDNGFYFIVTLCLSALLKILILTLTAHSVMTLGKRLTLRVYDKLLTLDYENKHLLSANESISHANKVDTVVATVIVPIFTALTGFILSISLLFSIILTAPALGFFVFSALVIIYIMMSVIFQRRLKYNSIVLSENMSKKVSTIENGIKLFSENIFYNTQNLFRDRLEIAENKIKNTQALNMVISSIPKLIIEALGILLIIIFIFLSQTVSFIAPVDLAVLGTFALAAQRLLPHLQSIYSVWSKYTSNLRLIMEINQILKLPTHKNISSSDVIRPFRGAVMLRNIEMNFADESNVIKYPNITIKYGKLNLIKGKSGAGKSTLLQIITSQIKPTVGVIEIDGVQLNTGNVNDWRSQIAYVPQKNFIFDGTIYENITLNKGQTTNNIERLNFALSASRCDEFIRKLPKGIETLLVDNAAELSGGQAQRISLARALYSGRKVLVFDEVTSALDSENEHAFLESVNLLRNEYTILVVSHSSKFDEIADITIDLNQE